MKKTGIILLIVVLVMLINSLIGVIVMAIRNRDFNWWQGGSIERTSQTIQKQKEYDVSQIKDLNLRFVSSDINIILTEEPDLKVIQYANKKLEEKELFDEQGSNSTLTINEKTRNNWFFNFMTTKMAFDIYLPKNYRNNLKIASVSGDILWDNEMNLQSLEIALTSGSIRLTNKITAKEIDITSVSGDIILEEIKSDEIILKTTSGEIDAKKIVGDAELKTVSGDIKVEEMEGSIVAKTTSGDIKFQNMIGSADIKTTSGDIFTNNFKILGKSKIKTVSGTVKGSLKQETNYKITTDTVSGSVKLVNETNKVNEEDYYELEIKTTSGSIRFE